MGIDEIWTRLAPETRDWLIANNGDAVPADIAAEIDELIEAADADDIWANAPGTYPGGPLEPDDVEDADDLEDADDDPGARYLVDNAVDWIEDHANSE